MADIKTSPCGKDMDIYIDGEPVSDEFDIKGIDLDKYNIKIEDDIAVSYTHLTLPTNRVV